MAKTNARVVSADIFRGLAVAFMIIIIAQGNRDVYPFLRPSAWQGFAPADLIFPFFLFVAGISSFMSMKKYGNELNWASFLRILRRVAAIFALGLLLEIFPHFGRDYSTLRIMGVLQRVAVAYGIGTFVCLVVRRDYLWLVITLLLLIYWGLLFFPGGNAPYSAGNNFAEKADMAILGAKHLYQGFGRPFDPEGITGSISAATTVIAGYYTGEMAGKGQVKGKSILKLILLGVSASGLGYLWSIFFPFNRYLWTGSYALLTTGFALASYSVIIFFTDIFKFRKWGVPFIVFGSNALSAYVVTIIWTRLLLNITVHVTGGSMNLGDLFYNKVCVPVAGKFNGSLIFSIVQVLIIWMVMLILYRKKLFIRL
jgi:predicted acyltransferase